VSRGAHTRRLTCGLFAAAVTAVTVRALSQQPPGGHRRWTRTNFRDAEVDLLAGPAAAAGAAAATLPLAVRGRPGPLLLTVVTGSLGLYDDLAGQTHARGLGGHLRALRRGQVTTGLVKMVGLFGVAAVTVGAGRPRSAPVALAGVVADAALVSGTANLINLLDLRPGRALKAVTLLAVPVATLGRDSSAELAAGLVGTAAVLLPGDLGERRMVGDCGANTLGALAGWALADRLGRTGRTVALAVVVALTLASERVSFSAVIDRTPSLHAIDMWGRQPA